MKARQRRYNLPWSGRGRRPQRRPNAGTHHYRTHKETARTHITARIEYWNRYYQLRYNRIAIRNQRSRWGSCSALGNLNFNYKLLFLPPHLCDYIVVHELCHLQELNHSSQFWSLVAKTMPEYKKYIQELRNIEQVVGSSVSGLIAIQAQYQSHTKK